MATSTSSTMPPMRTDRLRRTRIQALGWMRTVAASTDSVSKAEGAMASDIQ